MDIVTEIAGTMLAQMQKPTLAALLGGHDARSLGEQDRNP